MSKKPEPIQFDHISINFSAYYKDATGEQKQYVEQASISMNSDDEVNRILKEKPYLLEIIPAFIQRANENHDPNNEHLKKLKDAIGNISK